MYPLSQHILDNWLMEDSTILFNDIDNAESVGEINVPRGYPSKQSEASALQSTRPMTKEDMKTYEAIANNNYGNIDPARLDIFMTRHPEFGSNMNEVSKTIENNRKNYVSPQMPNYARAGYNPNASIDPSTAPGNVRNILIRDSSQLSSNSDGNISPIESNSNVSAPVESPQPSPAQEPKQPLDGMSTRDWVLKQMELGKDKQQILSEYGPASYGQYSPNGKIITGVMNDLFPQQPAVAKTEAPAPVTTNPISESLQPGFTNLGPTPFARTEPNFGPLKMPQMPSVQMASYHPEDTGASQSEPQKMSFLQKMQALKNRSEQWSNNLARRQRAAVQGMVDPATAQQIASAPLPYPQQQSTPQSSPVNNGISPYPTQYAGPPNSTPNPQNATT